MNVVVVGAQWGDEGKGKIVDYLSSEADIVIRFSGGANAGHRIKLGDTYYDFHLLPSGLLNSQAIVILGNAMVIDPEAFFKEISLLESQGLHLDDRVLISDRAHLVLPQYLHQDRFYDTSRTKPIGTTGKGIGVAYSLKAQRTGIRVADLLSNSCFASLPHDDQEYLAQFRDRLEKMSVDLPRYMDHTRDKKILFEGAQGVMLDLDIGSYPYVTSSTTTTAGALTGGSVPAHEIDLVLGIFKAYSTRVGNGPFPSEFREGQKELEEKIRTIGNEFGVTTGRARRCGYLDLAALRYACRGSGITELALTHLDVYDSFDEIGVCVAYEHEGETIDWVPASAHVLEELRPVVKKFPGWKEDTTALRDWKDFPSRAKEYLQFVEDYVGVDVSIVSVGPERSQTILRKDLWP